MSSYSDFTSSGGFSAHHEPSNKADLSESEVQRETEEIRKKLDGRRDEQKE